MLNAISTNRVNATSAKPNLAPAVQVLEDRFERVAVAPESTESLTQDFVRGDADYRDVVRFLAMRPSIEQYAAIARADFAPPFIWQTCLEALFEDVGARADNVRTLVEKTHLIDVAMVCRRMVAAGLKAGEIDQFLREGGSKREILCANIFITTELFRSRYIY